MHNNYDKIARCYDGLSRLVFFRSQVNAQVHQLRYLPDKGSVLIAGGGTGWILEEIAKVRPSGLSIVYIELSVKMIGLAANRDYKANNVTFVHLGIEDFETTATFDAVLTPFLFDNFSGERAQIVFSKLHGLLSPNGHWLFADFTLSVPGGRWWKRILLASMYCFFKLIGNIEATHLTDMSAAFLKEGYQVIEEKFYYGSFIRAAVYKKAA